MLFQRALVVLLSFFVCLLHLLPTIFCLLPCEDLRCKTGLCAEDGACLCFPPDPYTTLDNEERLFLGGRFCDEVQVMCGEKRNSLWCEHGGRCQEAKGEDEYLCLCRRGYAGRHCELMGVPCGESFCFRGAQCLVDYDICECPPNWTGSPDCLLPTTNNASIVKSASAVMVIHEGHHTPKWLVAVVVLSSSLVVVAAAAAAAAVVIGKKCLKNTESSLTSFHQMAQIHVEGILDDEDDIRPIPELNDGAHL